MTQKIPSDLIADDAIDSAQIADGAIDTIHIADDQITLAKMAGGTDGNIISYDASGNPVAIATGSDGQVLTSAGAGNPPAFEDAAGGGITHASQWRLTTNFNGDAQPITSNLEEVDGPSGMGILGASMTQSSGVFTFPATGYWRIHFQALYYHTAVSEYTDASIFIITDPTSDDNWGRATYGRSGTAASGTAAQWGNPVGECIFDVTNTSTHRCRFQVKTADDLATCKGDTGYNYTYMTFIRLGDT